MARRAAEASPRAACRGQGCRQRHRSPAPRPPPPPGGPPRHGKCPPRWGCCGWPRPTPAPCVGGHTWAVGGCDARRGRRCGWGRRQQAPLALLHLLHTLNPSPPQPAAPHLITGTTRSASSSALSGCDLGCVDWPPTSSRSAPSATICRPAATAASTLQRRGSMVTGCYAPSLANCIGWEAYSCMQVLRTTLRQASVREEKPERPPIVPPSVAEAVWRDVDDPHHLQHRTKNGLGYRAHIAHLLASASSAP